MKTNIQEALRYLGSYGDIESEQKAIKATEEIESLISPQYIFRIFDLIKTADGFKLSGTDILIQGKTAEKMLSGCSKAAVLCCSLGLRFDTMLRVRQARNMAGAVIYDACGSAYVEYGCDLAEKEIQDLFPEMYLSDRFSPGYGDLSLEMQEDILTLLDAGKRLGVHLTSSMLMNPTKTVTAFVGISPVPQKARIKGCAFCTFRENCTLRKEGKSCGS